MLLTLIVDADEAVRSGRLAVGSNEPPTGVFDPEPCFRGRIGTQTVLNLVGDAVTVIALVGLHDDVETRLRIVGIEDLRISAAACGRRNIGNEQHVFDVRASRQGIGIDVPVIGDFTDGNEDACGVDRRGLWDRCWRYRDG